MPPRDPIDALLERIFKDCTEITRLRQELSLLSRQMDDEAWRFQVEGESAPAVTALRKYAQKALDALNRGVV